MPKQSTHGGTKILNDQRGNILILGVFLILTISILFAGLVEFGRIMIVREQLQTAADSAALAGAGSGTHRQVKINVITDRGQQTACCGKDCSPCCHGCSTIRLNGFIGNEKKLIDEGGWRDFCIPPCNCGGDDCWFELVERELMYDTHSMGWGTNPQEIINAEKELTETTREFLAQSVYNYTPIVTNMVKRMSLQQMQALLANQQNWLGSWMTQKGYSYDCYYLSHYYGEYYDCQEWRNIGIAQYSQALKTKKSIDSIITSLQNIKTANTRPVQKIDAQYAGSAATFFEANLPKHATDSGITKLKVYGYENHNSPYYPSVVVYATAKIKTLFPQWFKEDFTTTVCAQGTTAYKDDKNQIVQGGSSYGGKYGFSNWNKYRWRKLPDKACWVDF